MIRCLLRPLGLVLALSPALLLPACGEQGREKAKDIGRAIGEKAGASWASIREFTVEQKDQAVAFFATSKEALAEELEQAKARSAGWTEEAKASLDARWEDVQATYAKAREATGEGWATARDGFSAAVEAFREELRKHGD